MASGISLVFATAVRTGFGAEEAIPSVSGLLRPIDTAALIKKLNLERRGRERGLRESFHFQ